LDILNLSAAADFFGAALGVFFAISQIGLSAPQYAAAANLTQFKLHWYTSQNLNWK